MLSSEVFVNSPKPLLLALGRDIPGQTLYADLGKMPHILIAGATGSGKSVTIHAIIASLLYRNSPHQLRFLMIDPKRVELTLYNNIPHLLTPVITDPKKAILALKWAAKEMSRRYDILEAESVRDIDSYHKNIYAPAQQAAQHKGKDLPAEKMPDAMPYIAIIIDEIADIMQTYPRELESAIVRLAQMSRAVGIHLLLSTQRPSVNVITGLIKANIPARIALQVSSQIDSRTILDSGGAEKLLGAGDMLYLSGEMSKPRRLQSAFVSEEEVKRIVKFIAKQRGDAPAEIELSEGGKNVLFDSMFDEEAGGDDDDLYEEAREVVMHAEKASTSYLQRKLRVGYARAARLMDILEERGVIGPPDGSKPRDVLIKPDEGFGVAHDEIETEEEGYPQR
jgi:S-DNA-T family DNA segregation ATPase FtsK/SpoIIIE